MVGHSCNQDPEGESPHNLFELCWRDWLELLEISLRVDDIRIHDEFNQATSHTPGSRGIVSKYETVPG